MKKEYNVSIIGLEIENDNLGCVALTLSFINILEQIGKELGASINITAISYSDKQYECNDIIRKFDVIRVHPKSFSFWSQLKHNFKEADLVFDFTLGDSFSDIYGADRYIKTNLLKDFAEKYNVRFILGPQTYGPYNSAWSRRWAKRIIKKAYKVYSRDKQSADVIKQMCDREATVVTDVAFGLTYTAKDMRRIRGQMLSGEFYEKSLVNEFTENAEDDGSKKANLLGQMLANKKSFLSVECGQMLGYMTLPPKARKSVYTPEIIMKFLEKCNIKSTIDQKTIENLLSHPGEKVLIATGIDAVDGTNGYYEYCFDRDNSFGVEFYSKYIILTIQKRHEVI